MGRRMGRLSGVVLVVLAALLPFHVAADECPQQWSEVAADNAKQGVALFNSGRSHNLVTLWRRLALNERTPERHYSPTTLATWWNPTPLDTYREAAARFEARATMPRRYGPGAFGYAVSLLGERIRLLGLYHPYVRAWVANQDIVYGYINTTVADPINLPKPYDGAIEGLPPGMAAEDLAYQIATARYYAGAYNLALADFRAIAASPSRHRLAAAYMVPKTLAMAGDGEGMLREIDAILSDPALAAIHVGSQQLYGFLRNRLRQETEAESGPVYVEVKRRALVFDADILTLPAAVIESDPELATAFQDAVFNLDFYLRSPTDYRSRRTAWREDWWLDGESGGAFGAAAREREILDWLQAARGTLPYATFSWSAYLSEWTQRPEFQRINDHIDQQLNLSGNPLPWLLLAEARRRGFDTYGKSHSSAALAELQANMASCRASEPEQVAAGPLARQMRRQETMAGDWVGLWASYGSRNWRSQAARYLESSVDIAERARRLGFPDADMGDMPMLALSSLDEVATRLRHVNGIPDDLASLLNMLPAATLLPLLDDPRIAPHNRAVLARMAWLRANLLGNADLREKLQPHLVSLHPELVPMLDETGRRWSETERRLAELRLVLKTPGFNLRLPMRYQMWAGRWTHTGRQDILAIDGHNPSDGNWWCQLSPGGEFGMLQTAGFDEPLGLSQPDKSWYRDDPRLIANAITFRTDIRDNFRTLRERIFQWHPLVRLIDWSELAALSRIEAAPRHLGRQTIDLIRNAGWYDLWYYDDEMAELLGLVVRATRFGCRRDRGDGDISREAFMLLHELFPESETAKATRYWYN